MRTIPSQVGWLRLIGSSTDRHLPEPSEEPHEELRSLAERKATLNRRRDDLREIAELEDEGRIMEHLLSTSEQASRTPTTTTLSPEGLDERPAQRQRVDSGSFPIARRCPQVVKAARSYCTLSTYSENQCMLKGCAIVIESYHVDLPDQVHLELS